MMSEQIVQTRPHGQPFAAYKREQARISRHRMYPITAFYGTYSVIMFVLATRSAHPYIAFAFYLAGFPVWTFIEYLSHRYILHGRFKQSKKWWKKHISAFAHKRLDPLHWEHHERPFDGLHISGSLKDLLPLFAVVAPLSFIIFPVYTAPMMLAAVTMGYVLEEWVHHSVHYYNFRSPYFRYIKKHHVYHHTSQGMNRGFGTTSAIWDTIIGTRFPETVRQRLYGRSRRTTLDAATSNTRTR
jgi:sterol desaturase/sphingolipid hydroxylase (fatty acid hydroxylase superfamily)